MWPLLLLGLWGFLHVVGNEQRHLLGRPPVTKISGETGPKYLPLLSRVLKAGHAPQRWLVDEAVREAFELGDWKAVSAIASRFPLTPPQTANTDEVVSSPKQVDAPPSNAAIIIGKNSPFDGVSNEEWAEFCEKLKTQAPDFKSDKHVGAYHHNRERLTQLGYDPATLTDEATQYQALEKDLKDYSATEKKLINDFGGDLIDIDGESHPVSMSGVLGVLKAAGPKHARSWFKNPEERKAFPHTTETFKRCNGMF